MSTLALTLEARGEGSTGKPYVVIPMLRLLDNDELLNNNTIVDRSTPNLRLLSQLAPEAPDEPQIGFRWDTTENYQIAMRYGRRSTLELLWRLGAVPRSRNLDRRTLPWESSDRAHLTAESYASVPGPAVDVKDPVAFAKAGWVYRLFSGDASQESSNAEASVLRNMNRIRGIVAFLERLDEALDRGKLCPAHQDECGFKQVLTWRWDLFELDRLRREVAAGRRESVDRAMSLRVQAREAETAVRRSRTTAQEAAEYIAVIALAGYINSDQKMLHNAINLVHNVFLPDGSKGLTWLPLTDGSPTAATDGVAYTFPLLHAPEAHIPLWTRFSSIGVSESPLYPSVELPYAPEAFDPTPLLDAIRLIRRGLGGSCALRNEALEAIFSAHLAWLLSDQRQLLQSRLPESFESAAHYDVQVAALAAFLDDVRLLKRVNERARLRHSPRALDPALEAGMLNMRMLDDNEDAARNRRLFAEGGFLVSPRWKE